MQFRHDGFKIFTYETDREGRKIAGTERQHSCHGMDDEYRFPVLKAATTAAANHAANVPRSCFVVYEIHRVDSSRPAMEMCFTGRRAGLGENWSWMEWKAASDPNSREIDETKPLWHMLKEPKGQQEVPF